MSAGPRIPLDQARRIAVFLIDQLQMGADALVVGSVRRERPDVGDIEIVAPMPDEDGPDLLERRIDQLFGPPPGASPLFMDDEEVGSIGQWLAGLKPRFRTCSLVLRSARDQGRVLPVQLHRYDPGPGGNRGWIEMIRTGPREFGVHALWRWKQSERGRGGRSDQGYPCQPGGTRIPTPTERRALELCGLPWIEPRDRDEYVVSQRGARSVPC